MMLPHERKAFGSKIHAVRRLCDEIWLRNRRDPETTMVRAVFSASGGSLRLVDEYVTYWRNHMREQGRVNG